MGKPTQRRIDVVLKRKRIGKLTCSIKYSILSASAIWLPPYTAWISRLRSSLVACPPTGPSSPAPDLVIATEDFQKDLSSWNIWHWIFYIPKENFTRKGEKATLEFQNIIAVTTQNRLLFAGLPYHQGIVFNLKSEMEFFLQKRYLLASSSIDERNKW